MRFRIIKIVLSGMKGIEKEMSFQFQNETINYSDIDKPSVKAVYGSNGAGKSSFITALDVYKQINTSYSYLVENSSVRKLNNLINKKTRSFRIKVFFMDSETKSVYSHELLINNKMSKPFIEKERLAKYFGKTINDNEFVLFETKGKDIVYMADTDAPPIYGYLKKAIEKKNEYCSVLSFVSDINFIAGLNEVMYGVEEFSQKSLCYSLIASMTFILNVSVFVGESDRHDEIDEVQFGSLSRNVGKDGSFSSLAIRGENVIAKEKLSVYQSNVNRLEKFIKLFKPELSGIEIDKRLEEGQYHCRLNMKYDSYSIDYEYESTGIKNLVSIFSCLENASKGNISFIDEMDANLNEIYLKKLCDYFVEYSKGQLCFTTHNTAPMKILKSRKYGIDFINSEQEKYMWVRDGNYSPAKLYEEGMIPGLPFNIESFDFLEVFSSED